MLIYLVKQGISNKGNIFLACIAATKSFHQEDPKQNQMIVEKTRGLDLASYVEILISINPSSK